MFGPAFIEAYQIEKTHAKYPRVLLSKDAYEDWKTSEPNFWRTVRLTEDGPPCVYIFAMLEQMLTADGSRIEGRERAAKCRITIRKLAQQINLQSEPP